MLETEISKTGDVTVEGHVIGHLQGFQFAPDPTAGGEEAKALRAAAQKALAGEIEARATRVGMAVDEAFVLTADGTIRWTGEPVAKLIPGDEVLKPRFKIIADEHLTGAARDQVEARLALWLKAHVEKLLGPLQKLAEAEDITGIGRGIAFQIVEALGVLERTRVAEEMKTLDQAARATLRGYGVRFGAHHIYLPGLLKPAPRALAAELYALKHGGLAQKGLDELPHLAASGRTSIPVDPEIHKGLYRAVGFRVCGERAVRVDILERLADLIRPALAWRPQSPGPKPAGAVDGRGFTVTVGMTSLAGCSGEDFASILRSLGYRMERRAAPPPEAPAAEAAAELAPAPEGAIEADLLFDPVETPAAGTEGETADSESAAAPETPASEGEADVVETTDAEAQDDAAEVDAAPEDAAPEDAAADAATEAGDAEAAGVPDAPVEAVEAVGEGSVDISTEAADAAALEPALIEVWRPGRPPGAPRRERPGREGQRQGQGQGEGRGGDRKGGERKGGERKEGDRRDWGRGGQNRRSDRPQERAAAPASGEAPAEGQGQRPPRQDRPPFRGPRENEGQRGTRPERVQVHQDRRRDKPMDPDSPFAALAALKARLEAEKKGS